MNQLLLLGQVIVRLLGVVVEVNLPQTLKVLVAHDLVIDEEAEDVLADEVLNLLPPEGRLLLKDTVFKEPKHPVHPGEQPHHPGLGPGAANQHLHHLLAPQHLGGGGQ